MDDYEKGGGLLHQHRMTKKTLRAVLAGLSVAGTRAHSSGQDIKQANVIAWAIQDADDLIAALEEKEVKE